MFRQWKIIANNGDADFRLYDRSLAGADYICKCLGANSYEVNKYSLAESTTLSDSVISLIRMMDANSERRFRELNRKMRQVANGPGFKTDFRMGTSGLPGSSNIRDITGSNGAGMASPVPACGG
jgi:hypothetical protein